MRNERHYGINELADYRHPTNANITATSFPTSTTTAATALTGLTSGGLVPFGGSLFAGYVNGFALKKIIKWLLIGLGVLAGIMFIVTYASSSVQKTASRW